MRSPFIRAALELAEDILPSWSYKYQPGGIRVIVSVTELQQRFGNMGECQFKAIRLEILDRLTVEAAADIKL